MWNILLIPRTAKTRTENSLKLRKKTIQISVTLLFLLFFTFQFLVPYALKSYVNTKITEFKHIEGSIGNVDISFFGNDWTLEEVVLVSNSEINNTTLTIEKVQLGNINLYQTFVQEKFEIGLLRVTNPIIKLQKGGEEKRKIDLPFKFLEINRFEIEGGSISFFNQNVNDTLFASAVSSIKLNSVLVDTDKPYYFKSSSIDEAILTNIHTKINEFDVLEVGHLVYKGNTNTAHINSLSIATALDKKELSKVIKTERDHTNFTLDILELNELDFQISQQQSSISVNHILLSEFDLDIYRDKLVTDDRKKKRYYGALLRGLPFKLEISKITIEDGNLNYAEKINPGIKPENLVFENISGEFNDLQNFTNLNVNGELSGQIMGEATLKVNYKMNPLDLKESFMLKGSLADFTASSVNPFLRTSTGTTSKGYIDQMFFTIDGNTNRAIGDVKMKYENFEIQVLKKDLLKINKFLSFLGNLIINDGSKSDENGYRYGAIQVEPDTSKSFINYLWNCLMDGMLNTVTGNGKK